MYAFYPYINKNIFYFSIKVLIDYKGIYQLYGTIKRKKKYTTLPWIEIKKITAKSLNLTQL